MSSDQQTPNPVAYQSQSAYADEISLVDIVRVLLRRKMLIFGIMAIVAFLGGIYAFSQERVYQVETLLLPPSYGNVEQLKVLNNGNDVFTSFVATINSRKLKKSFFNDSNLVEILSDKPAQTLTDKDINDLFEGFSKSIKVKGTKVTLEGTHKEKIGPLLDGLVVMANQETIKQLVKNIELQIDSKINNIRRSISSKRSIYKQRRRDELARLEEALEIAKNLGIHEFNSISSTPLKNNSLSIYTQPEKTYIRGTKVIQAEINTLKNRKSDDPYINGLRDLQEEITSLEAIKIDKNKIKTVIVDKKAAGTVKPVRPNRKLIVILSLFLGGVLGIFAVFIMEFFNKLKEQANNESALDVSKNIE